MSDKIKDAIKTLAEGGKKTTRLQYGEVLEVDRNNCTCSLKMNTGGFTKTDVKLKSVESGNKGLVIVPKKGSTVAVANIDKSSDNLTVLKCDEVEAVELRMDNVELIIEGGKVRLNANEIVFNNGNNRGLVKIEELVNRINALEQHADTHVHIGVTPGTGASGTVQSPSFVPPTTIADLEDDKVKH